MSTRPLRSINRRHFLQGSGALVVWFSLTACASTPTATPSTAPAPAPTARPVPSPPPTTTAATAAASPTAAAQPSIVPASPLPSANQIDAWLAIGADGKVTVFSGKVELGTGTMTALAQIVADELRVPFSAVTMIMGDTARTPNEGYTAGSKTIQTGGVNLRRASAQAREALLAMAAKRLGVPAARLTVRDGIVSSPDDPSKTVSYGELIGNQRFNLTIDPKVPVEPPERYTIVGQPVKRVDLPGKIFGTWTYVQDVRVPGMLHGRVIRPRVATQSGVNAVLESVDESSISDLPGVRIVRDGNFLGVVAEREWDAIQAAQRLKATWRFTGTLPPQSDLERWILAQKTRDAVIARTGDVEAALSRAARILSATYVWPYQAHASIGPSCAVADVRPDGATIWSSTQGVYPLRDALARLLGLRPEQVRVIHVEGAGCYGHNGFDDVAADAALLSRAVGRPVRVQWMRQDEFGWEPKGPAMVLRARGGLDEHGSIIAWDRETWTPTHSTRPGGQPGNLLAGLLLKQPAPRPENSFAGGDRNAATNYTFANSRTTIHWLSDWILRPSALRSLGGAANTFANESFMDELAAAAGADPIAFRLRYLTDPRAVAVVRAAAVKAGWQSRPSPAPSSGSGVARGRGFAFSRYENTETYVATVAEVEVDRSTGAVRVTRVVVAHDCGLVINPDGLINQIEGNVLQATSRALKEEVTFDDHEVTSLDWSTYHILTFPEVPTVEVELINRPDQPAWGAGEPTTENLAAAIANAVFDATGARVRTVPLTAERVTAALAAAGGSVGR